MIVGVQKVSVVHPNNLLEIFITDEDCKKDNISSVEYKYKYFMDVGAKLSPNGAYFGIMKSVFTEIEDEDEITYHQQITLLDLAFPTYSDVKGYLDDIGHIIDLRDDNGFINGLINHYLVQVDFDDSSYVPSP